MAIPTQATSGSEVLRRGSIDALSNTETAFKFDGTSPTMGTDTYTVPTNHIITMLTIVITDQTNAVKYFNLWANDNSFLKEQYVTADNTYIWNDRFVLHPADKLYIDGESGANFDVFYTYLDQNWE